MPVSMSLTNHFLAVPISCPLNIFNYHFNWIGGLKLPPAYILCGLHIVFICEIPTDFSGRYLNIKATVQKRLQLRETASYTSIIFLLHCCK